MKAVVKEVADDAFRDPMANTHTAGLRCKAASARWHDASGRRVRRSTSLDRGSAPRKVDRTQGLPQNDPRLRPRGYRAARVDQVALAGYSRRSRELQLAWRLHCENDHQRGARLHAEARARLVHRRRDPRELSHHFLGSRIPERTRTRALHTAGSGTGCTEHSRPCVAHSEILGRNWHQRNLRGDASALFGGGQTPLPRFFQTSPAPRPEFLKDAARKRDAIG